VTSCTTADFANRSGAALASYITTVDWYACINPLFDLTGSDARAVFQESQMLSVANGVASAAASYNGDDSAGIYELLYFLRAGYYVQSNHPSDVGTYDSNLTGAVESGFTALFNSSHANDVSAGNGDVLYQAFVVTDSAQVQGAYLNVYRRYLNAYNSSWDAYPAMDRALNAIYTPLWRGPGIPTFVTAVTADPGIADTLNSFTLNHRGLLGGDNDALDWNAGNDLANMLQISALQAKVRPLVKGLLGASSVTGPTANLWVHVAYRTTVDDAASECSYYGTCDLAAQLTAVSLPNSHACDNRTIKSQSLSTSDAAAVCASLHDQDPFFHGLVKDNGPIPGQYESKYTLAVWATKFDYSVYSWVIYGNDTDNGGETLDGNPSDPNNVVVSVEYIKSPDDGFVAGVWNLNHEYTHVLDGAYDLKGDFATQISVNDVWWIEGVAEYVSYTYRNVSYPEAIAAAGQHTYKLSTLFQNNYTVDDTARTYYWGYLAVRYMFEKHPADITAMLSHFRTGDYAGGYAVYNNVGTAYDADFDNWLTAVAGGGSGTLPACTDANPQAMGQNCSRTNRSAAAGDTDYLWIYLPAGTTTLTVTTSGGTGNADLYYDPTTWAGPSAYTAKSTNSGTSQSITVTNTSAGYRYVSLYGQTAFSGVTVTTQYRPGSTS
jgi:microbial collagenase